MPAAPVSRLPPDAGASTTVRSFSAALADLALARKEFWAWAHRGHRRRRPRRPTPPHALAQRGADVVLLQASGDPGGVIRSDGRDGYLMEWGPNTVRPTPELWSLTEGLAGSPPRRCSPILGCHAFVDWGGAPSPFRCRRAPWWGSRLLSLREQARLLPSIC